jgi:nicotinamidase-related amidase
MNYLNSSSALVIVDMQRYYLEENSVYSRYFNFLYPGCLSYIRDRAYKIVIPNIQRLIDFWRNRDLPIVYLRLCSEKSDRTDLHRFFLHSYIDGKRNGYDGVYPLCNEEEADIIPDIAPCTKDIVVNKTTFSPFSLTDIDIRLKSLGISSLIFTGLATSQCVETTARDASDRGYDVIHIEDAQADYDEMTHRASLYSSRGVCGGSLFDTESFIRYYKELYNV